ncbi:monocarboxylate transporter 12-like [Amphiura filiformis]|uniref:monocarboxylate transporter 12-like n=1 Tax=Amphiura filiformis TaxID=82378 RepID=UPI003B2229B1
MVATKPSVRLSSTQTPVDHGYAWVVLASCVLLRLLVDGFWSCLGILMLQWETRFNATASQTGWIGSSFMFILLSTAPAASALSHRLTYRVVVVGAGIIVCGCIFSLSLVTQLWQVYVIMPILGFGLGISYQTGMICFVYYFDKRYAFANGLASAAGGIGFFVGPPLMETLNTYFEADGALQLISAIMANICVLGALLRPSHQEQNWMTKSSNEKLKPTQSDFSRQETDDKSVERRFNACCTFLKELADSFDLSLFRRVPFVFQAILNGFLQGGIYCILVYIVPYSTSIGISDFNSSFLLSAIGASVCVARLSPLIGYLVDKKIVSKSMLTGTCYLVNGVATVIIPFTTSYGGLMAISVVFGMTMGIAGAMLMVICTMAAGSKDKAPGATAWCLLLCGIGSLVTLFFAGFLRDATGSFKPPLILCGVFTICTGFNCLIYPLQKRWQEKIDNHRKLKRGNSQHYYTSLADVSKSNQV